MENNMKNLPKPLDPTTEKPEPIKLPDPVEP